MNRLIALTLLVTAVHVVDDATLNRRPGTDAVGHLPAVGVTLLVLAAGAVAYRFARPGGRAALVALLGVFATTLGVLHVVEILHHGIGSRDVTALPALALGAGSLAAAVTMLWRSRRGRVIRPVLVAAATVAVAFFVVMPVLGGVVVTHKPRAATPSHLIGRAVTLRTSDGVELAARYVPSRNGAAVVVFPGRGDTRGAGRLLARHGYGVLLVDMRGTGASGGDSNAFGWGSRKDLRAAVDFLASRADAVGGIGYSVGGEQLLEAAAYDTRLQAVVSDGAGFRTVREAVRAREGTLPIDLVALWTVHVLSPESSPPPLWDLVARIAPRPLLLIEAGHGQGGEALNGLYARRAGRSAEHWLVPEAHHTGAYEARPREYERRVLGFFGASLLHA